MAFHNMAGGTWPHCHRDHVALPGPASQAGDGWGTGGSSGQDTAGLGLSKVVYIGKREYSIEHSPSIGVSCLLLCTVPIFVGSDGTHRSFIFGKEKKKIKLLFCCFIVAAAAAAV